MAFNPRVEYQDSGVAASYDRERFSSLAGRFFQWVERRSLARALRSLPRDARLLDAPVGTGRLLGDCLRHARWVLGGDISNEMIAMARGRVGRDPRVTFCRMDFAHIPLADGAVTAITSMRFLGHFPPAERVVMLREFRRVSSRIVVIAVALSTPWYRLRRRLKKLLGTQVPIRHPVTERGLREELSAAGLKEVRRVWTLRFVSEQLLVVCERA